MYSVGTKIVHMMFATVGGIVFHLLSHHHIIILVKSQLGLLEK